MDEIRRTLERSKTRTTPRSPEDGFLQAVADRKIRLDDVFHFLHGTTLVTNLIIERTGAKVGLITTKGFRDVLEIQRSYRDELYNLQWDKPKALVPRHLRLTIDERVDAHGAVLRAADVAETRAVVQPLLDLGGEAIAICLLNAYANTRNEMAVARVGRGIAPRHALC